MKKNVIRKDVGQELVTNTLITERKALKWFEYVIRMSEDRKSKKILSRGKKEEEKNLGCNGKITWEISLKQKLERMAKDKNNSRRWLLTPDAGKCTKRQRKKKNEKTCRIIRYFIKKASLHDPDR